MTFGEKIKEKRKLNNLTQVELAEKLEIGKSTLAMYETDKREPNVLMIKKISKILNVSADELIGNKFANKNTSRNSNELKLLEDYNLLNEEGKAYVDKQIKFALSQTEYQKIDLHSLSS